ncbi:MAG: pyridoxamine 5'-phosphate oxidase family protein [Acidaminococcaceae bacterium]
MFSPQIKEILKRQLFFLGTTYEATPRVRPMRPFVDDGDNIWLISYKGTEKNKEIELNNKVELCTVDNNDVLRLQGSLLQENNICSEEIKEIRQQIFDNLPYVKEIFKEASDPNMVVYKLIVSNVIFRSLGNADISELHFKL